MRDQLCIVCCLYLLSLVWSVEFWPSQFFSLCLFSALFQCLVSRRRLIGHWSGSTVKKRLSGSVSLLSLRWREFSSLAPLLQSSGWRNGKRCTAYFVRTDEWFLLCCACISLTVQFSCHHNNQLLTLTFVLLFLPVCSGLMPGLTFSNELISRDEVRTVKHAHPIE